MVEETGRCRGWRVCREYRKLQEKFTIGCGYGTVEMIQEMLFRYPEQINPRAHQDVAFDQACIHGQLDVARWLSSFYPLISPPSFSVLLEVLRGGHFSILSWMLEKWGTSLIPGNRLSLALATVCGAGHLAIAQWLVRTYARFSLNSSWDEIFLAACTYNRLAVAQWIFTHYEFYLSKEKINRIFLQACDRHAHPLALWLFSTNPQMHLQNQDAAILNFLNQLPPPP